LHPIVRSQTRNEENNFHSSISGTLGQEDSKRSIETDKLKTHEGTADTDFRNKLRMKAANTL